MIRWLVLALVATPLIGAAAQVPTDTVSAGRDSAVKVFVDCPDFSSGCDFDFFRTEITFVNYTQNPQDAQVHVLITTQSTGSGGTEYTVTLIGQKEFSGRADTLHYAARPAEPSDDSRHGVARLLKLGLVAYAARTPLAARIHVSFDAPKGAAAQVHDPWNYWVYRMSLNADLSGQQSFHSGFGFGSISANRTTDRWKMNFGINGSYSESDFKLPVTDSLGNEIGTETVSSVQRSYSLDALLVRSAGPHWGVGGRASVANSLFSNERLAARIAPAVEYNIFPYAQSTRQLLTLRYEVGVTRYNYLAVTLFGHTSETTLDESLTLTASAKETWGSVDLSLSGAHLFSDVHKNHISLFGGTSLNLYRGLSVNISGDVSVQHDQISLPSAGASQQDVLLQRRQLASSFSYFTFVGFSFSFGSIFNNIVNPRFGNSGGGFSFSFSN